MIVGEKIIEIKGSRVPGKKIESLNLNISIDGVEEKDGFVEITYTFSADYKEGAGSLSIKGILVADEEEGTKKKILEEWKKSKTLPPDYATTVLSAVNYSGSANGTLLARVLGLTAPFIPPRIQITKR